MRVDMSSEAVTTRLRIMDELWLLSVKLMNSRPAKPKQGRGTAARALKIYDSIGRVLDRDWDPIGVAKEDGLKSEYDAYIAPVYRILVGSRSESDLIECLSEIELKQIGTRTADAQVLRRIATKLLALSVTLDELPVIAEKAAPERDSLREG